jgi:hypothetical protein
VFKLELEFAHPPANSKFHEETSRNTKKKSIFPPKKCNSFLLPPTAEL